MEARLTGCFFGVLWARLQSDLVETKLDLSVVRLVDSVELVERSDVVFWHRFERFDLFEEDDYGLAFPPLRRVRRNIATITRPALTHLRRVERLDIIRREAFPGRFFSALIPLSRKFIALPSADR